MGAKLFGTAALVIAVIGFFVGRLPHAAFGFVVEVSHIVLSTDHVLLAFALLCGIFAASYYLADRAMGARLSAVLSVGHFLLWMFALVAFSVEEVALAHTLQSGRDPNQSRLILGGSAAAVLAFLVGGLLFLINLAWAITRRFRTS